MAPGAARGEIAREEPALRCYVGGQDHLGKPVGRHGAPTYYRGLTITLSQMKSLLLPGVNYALGAGWNILETPEYLSVVHPKHGKFLLLHHQELLDGSYQNRPIDRMRRIKAQFDPM